MKKKRRRESANRAKSKPVSLDPKQVQFVEKRADKVGGVSRYFQMLVDYDRKNDIVPNALKRLIK
jgi:hypothetical protein